jgi:hypothetical protein
MVFRHFAAGQPRRAFIIVLSLLLLLNAAPAVPHAQPIGAAPAAAVACDQVAAVPPGECTILVELYNATGGASWNDSTGWPMATAAAPCDWHGVVCANGHVVELALAANRLTGVLPGALGGLAALADLDLAGNHLEGAVPPSVCTLTDSVTAADLGYNALFAPRSDTRVCLAQLDPDWAATQTTPPREVHPATFAAGAVQLNWMPIPYTTDGGFYEVSYATAPDGPFSVHGHSADKLANGYLVGGLLPGTTYYLRVQTVTPAHSGNPQELRSDYARTIVVTQAPEQILLMVYFPADNDLAPYVPPVIERLRLGTQLNPNVQVVMLADQSGTNDTRLLTIADGQITQTDAVFAHWGKRELDTADPATLAWFLRYARAAFPTTREIVSLMGHGLALAPEIEWPDTGMAPAAAAPPHGAIPALPRGIDATPGDVTDRGYMSTVDLGRALAEATDGGIKPFDLVFFDQCFQGSLDTLYEVRTAAEVFVASPNYAWLVAPYDQYLAMLAPAASNQTIADAIIMRYQRNLDDQHPNVIFSARRAEIDATAVAVDSLGQALLRAVRGGQRGPISGATMASKYVDTTQCGRQNLTLGPPDELIGAGTFAINLQRFFPAGDSYGVHDAAGQVLAAMAGVHKSVRTGYPYFAPEEFWDYDNTFTILAPLRPDLPAQIAWRSSVYTETMPLTATWTPMPTTTVQVTASYAYVRDSSWDSFLAAWYSAPLPPTVGEWCHYIPPALVPGAGLESLDLSVAGVDNTTVQLGWSATTEEDATGYWLYAKSSYDIGWVAQKIMPLSQTSLALPDLLPGSDYRFMIIAQDAAGVVLAESNEAMWKTFSGRMYLPVVRR